MLESLKIGLDQIVEIGDTLIEPKNLICSICFCLSIDSHQCRNKRCLKLFCYECIIQAKKKFKNCPFCRLGIEFKKAEGKLSIVYDKIKVICLEENICKEKFSIEDYFKLHSINNHLKLNKLLSCFACKKQNKYLNKCNICNNYSCLLCELLKLCINCKTNICMVCIGDSDNTKFNNDILCGICSCNCLICLKDNVYNEGKYICSLCKKIICEDCCVKCDDCGYNLCKDAQNCFREKKENCEICSNISVTQLYNKCIHEVLKSCVVCYSKCEGKTKDSCGGIIVKANNCAKCNKDICFRNCSVRCTNCKGLNCKKCVEFCVQCKASFCNNCVKKCFSCKTITSCISCNIETLKFCALCNEVLCINCWNICNYCLTNYCSKHTSTCINCEENCCEQHIVNCDKCKIYRKEDSNYKKLCMKNCTLKCSFCENSSNVLCEKNLHPVVSSLNCGHNVCTTCIKYCSKCPNKIVKSCPTCIRDYFYYFCNFLHLDYFFNKAII